MIHEDVKEMRQDIKSLLSWKWRIMGASAIVAFLVASLLGIRARAAGGYYPWGDIHWKAPVASSAALPASGNLTGDVRMELTAFGLYYWSGSAWVLITTGSGGSPGGANTDIQFNSSNSFGGSANLTWSGTVLGVTGSVNASNFTDSALGAGLPVLSTAPFSTGTISGNTTKFVTTTGTLTSGDGVKWDASGNAVDTGSPVATVSSVGLSMPAGGFSVSGSPVTGSGTLSVSYSGTFPNAQIPAAQAASLGGVESLACGSHEWMEQLANTGIFTCTQPGFSDLSGSASQTQLPNTIVYNNQANTYSSGPQSLGGQTLSDQIANATITGTTINKLAKINSQGSVVITATSDTKGAIGVVVAGAGTSGSADVAQVGQASCAFDGATTAGDYAIISSTTAGDCHDYGLAAPTNGDQAVGQVLSTNASAGTYAMQLLSGGGGGGAVTNPGGSSTDVQYNNGGVFGGNSSFTYDGSGNASLSGKISSASANVSGLTASEPVVSDGSKNLISGSVSAPLTYAAGAFGCQTASGSQAGCLASADWTTFNGKQAALPSQTGKAGDFLGTDGTNLSWGSVLSNPMTTEGDMLYENATPAIARLPAGSNGQVLQVSSGVPAWVTPTYTQGIIATYYVSSSSLSVTAGNQINFDTKTTDTNSAVTTGSSWKFTAPVAGNYTILFSGNESTGSAANIEVYKNGTAQFIITKVPAANAEFSGSNSIALAQSDTLDFRPSANSTFVGASQPSATATTQISIVLPQGGNVSSTTTGAEHVERVHFAACTSSPCSAASQSGSWIPANGLSRSSAGIYTLSIATGEFTSSPACVCNNSNAGGRYCGLDVTSATSVAIQTISNGSGSGAFEDDPIDIICMGPH
jgi:hypothetical protein